MTTPDLRGRGTRAFVVVVAWVALGCLAVVAAWALAADHNANGQCEGIGWGCTLTPRDAIALAAVFAGVPLATGTLVLGGACCGVAARRGWLPRSGAVLLGTLATAAGALSSLAVAGALLLAAQMT